MNVDNVRLTADVPRNIAVGVIGGGVKYLMTSRWGVRVDARAHLEQSKNEVFLDVSHGILCFQCFVNPGQTIAFGSDPSIQIGMLGQQSLNGSISDLRTVASDGLDKQVIVSVGVFRRF